VPLRGCVLAGYWADVAFTTSQHPLLIDTGSSTLAIDDRLCQGCASSRTAYTPGGFAIDQLEKGSELFGDGLSLSGEIYNDVVSLGTAPLPAISMNLLDVTAQSESFPRDPCSFGQGTYEGVLGLGPTSLAVAGTDAIADEMAASGLPDVFAFRVCQPLGGQLWLGGFGDSAASGLTQFTPLSTGTGYLVTMSDLSLDGQSMSDAMGPALVDTAAGVTSVPASVMTNLASIIATNPGTKDFLPGTWFTDGVCVQATPDQVSSLPPITLTFPGMNGAGSISVSLSADESYLVPTILGGTRFYCPGFAQGSSGTILGLSILRNWTVIFDRTGGRLGFAPPGLCM
jgi:hypothetical protein